MFLPKSFGEMYLLRGYQIVDRLSLLRHEVQVCYTINLHPDLRTLTQVAIAGIQAQGATNEREAQNGPESSQVWTLSALLTVTTVLVLWIRTSETTFITMHHRMRILTSEVLKTSSWSAILCIA